MAASEQAQSAATVPGVTEEKLDKDQQETRDGTRSSTLVVAFIRFDVSPTSGSDIDLSSNNATDLDRTTVKSCLQRSCTHANGTFVMYVHRCFSCIRAHIPLFLYPFLHTTKTTRPFEYLRLTSLGVIGALVKTDEQEVIQFLLSTEIIPLCLRIMENGTELSKTVATFILQKILLDDTGLAYICQTYERFSHVAMILTLQGKMVLQLAKDPSQRLLKHVVRCYSRLSDNPR
uniref:CCR4-NOT transcription complex subunit 9 n=1 Tax=Parascaris equorum TaxID=6256 RepID=A0A914RZA3_PAREQ